MRALFSQKMFNKAKMAKFSGHIYQYCVICQKSSMRYVLSAKQVACPRFGWYGRSSGQNIGSLTERTPFWTPLQNIQTLPPKWDLAILTFSGFHNTLLFVHMAMMRCQFSKNLYTTCLPIQDGTFSTLYYVQCVFSPFSSLCITNTKRSKKNYLSLPFSFSPIHLASFIFISLSFLPFATLL